MYGLAFLKQKYLLRRDCSQNFGRMRRHDKLHFRKRLLKSFYDLFLPRRMQVRLYFVNKNDAFRF